MHSDVLFRFGHAILTYLHVDAIALQNCPIEKSCLSKYGERERKTFPIAYMIFMDMLTRDRSIRQCIEIPISQ